MQDGTRYVDEFQGGELEWDLSRETCRIGPLFDKIFWPREGLESIVQAVTGLVHQARIAPLIQLCVG